MIASPLVGSSGADATRGAAESAIRQFLRGGPRMYSARLVGDRTIAQAAAASLLAAWSTGGAARVSHAAVCRLSFGAGPGSKLSARLLLGCRVPTGRGAGGSV
jgi:hypothetical protein